MRRLLLLLRTHSSRFGAASTKKNSLLQCQRFMIGCCLASSATSKAVRSFWFIGVITNASWFLMLAVATKISAGGVALVVSTHNFVIFACWVGSSTHILRCRINISSLPTFFPDSFFPLQLPTGFIWYHTKRAYSWLALQWDLRFFL